MKKISVAICIDDASGMLFLGKRQSRDRLLVADFLEMNKEKKIYISPFSKLLFENCDSVNISNDPFSACENGGTVFNENINLKPYLDVIGEIVLYKWNRRYLSDVKFDIDLDASGFKLTETYDFAGSSHDRITKEIYRKV